MSREEEIRIAHYLSYISRTVLVMIASFFLVYSLILGEEVYGTSFMGCVMNFREALPCFVLFFFVFSAWKWERESGVAIVVLGIISLFLFNGFDSLLILLTLSFPLLFLGAMLTGSWYLKNKKEIE